MRNQSGVLSSLGADSGKGSLVVPTRISRRWVAGFKMHPLSMRAGDIGDTAQLRGRPSRGAGIDHHEQGTRGSEPPVGPQEEIKKFRVPGGHDHRKRRVSLRSRRTHRPDSAVLHPPKPPPASLRQVGDGTHNDSAYWARQFGAQKPPHLRIAGGLGRPRWSATNRPHLRRGASRPNRRSRRAQWRQSKPVEPPSVTTRGGGANPGRAADR